MSWASRRRTVYASSVIGFFLVVFGIPFAIWWYESPSCFDGKQNQEETVVDKGGPCVLLDERTLSPYTVLWSRAFLARSGTYSAVAYVENPNAGAGLRTVGYRFRLYDERNIVIAEREGVTFLMPGGITPVFEGGIETGKRVATRTFFEFAEPFIWERLSDMAGIFSIRNKTVSSIESTPRVTAQVKNSSVEVVLNVAFVAVVFDTAGNAIAASHTTVPRLAGGEEQEIVFSWNNPLSKVVGRIDILPLAPPVVAQK